MLMMIIWKWVDNDNCDNDIINVENLIERYCRDKKQGRQSCTSKPVKYSNHRLRYLIIISAIDI